MLKDRLYALEASAGSGKTFSLVARYLSLLFKDTDASEIIAITFTNKASNEMQTRLQKALFEPVENNPLYILISDISGLSIKEIEQKQFRVKERFLQSHLNVMTIDKFINKILRKFCWYLELSNKFEIAPESKESFFERFLDNLDDNKYQNFVEFAQFESKKQQDILKFFEILYEKDKELPPPPKKPLKIPDESRIFEWANRLKEYVLNGDFSNTAKNGMSFESIEELVSKSWFGKDTLNYRTYKRGYIPQMDEWLNRLYDEVSIYYKAKESYFLYNIYQLYYIYKSTKMTRIKSSGKLDFKDIEHFVYELLQERELDREFLYFRLDSSISHVLFDEFQDTSITQYKIFEPILEEIAFHDNQKTLFYVGDTKQSIYRFRGGQKELFGYVAKRYDVDIDYLDTNYRSTEEIVNFVNEVFPPKYIQPKQKANEKGGYVQVTEIEKDNALHELKKVIVQLNEYGVKDSDIAILVHLNKDILTIEEYLKKELNKSIITHKRSKITTQPSATVLIESIKLLKAIHNEEDGSLYRLNILTILGKEYDPNFTPKVSVYLHPILIIKELMKLYGFSDEASVKLLEFAIDTTDIDHFLYEVESFEGELSATKLDGITVMTIHKSKGLEFEHLIVMDLLGRSSSDTSPVIFNYDEIELKSLSVKFKNRDKIDKSYQEVVNKEKSLKKSDAINRAYVAFTRAKESLIILKNSKSSAYDILSNLSPIERGKIKPSSIIQNPKNKTVTPVTLNQDYGRQDKNEEPKEYKANDYHAIYLGNGVHYLFESGSIESFINHYGNICNIPLALELYKRGKEYKEYQNLCRDAKLYKELGYIIDKKTGVIDLLIEKEDKYIILDYKTATPNDQRAYYKQVREYAKAIKILKSQKSKLEAYLYYLDRNQIVKVV